MQQKNMQSQLILLSLLMALISPCYGALAQNQDSLLLNYRTSGEGQPRLSALQDLFEFYINNDPKKASEFATEQLEYAQGLDDPLGIGQANYIFGVLSNNRNEFDSAEYWYNIALEHFEKANNRRKIATVNYGLAILKYYNGEYQSALDLLEGNMKRLTEAHQDSMMVEFQLMGKIHVLKGYIYFRKGNLNIAMDEILGAVRIFEKANDQVGLADAYNSLGSVESGLGNHQKSIDYNLLALEIYQDRNDKIYEAQALNDIGNNYFYLKQFDKAESYLDLSAKLSHELQSLDLEATAYTNLGKTYVAQKRYEQAVEVLTRGLVLVEETENPIKIVEIRNALGQSYQGLQDHEKAIQYFDRSIALAGTIGSLEALSQAYLYRSESFEKIGNLNDAFNDFKRFSELNDSIFNEAKSRQIEELRTIFELESKENEIQLQQNSIKLLEQEAQISHLQKIILVSGLISLAFVVGFGWYAFRQKIKKAELARQKMDAELHFKSRELTTQALHLAKKNETLENLKGIALQGRETDDPKGYHKLIQTISSDLRDDKGWDTFSRFFEEVHPDFFSKAAQVCPGLSPNDYRLMALIRMNLSSKEMANILSISIPGIKKARQRLRKKFGLDTTDSLEEAVFSI